MSVASELSRDLREQKRMLHQMLPPFRQGQVERMLRIEVGGYTLWKISDELRANGIFLEDPHHRTGQPMMFEGVSIYEVHHDLPECGWIIINPMVRTSWPSQCRQEWLI